MRNAVCPRRTAAGAVVASREISCFSTQGAASRPTRVDPYFAAGCSALRYDAVGTAPIRCADMTARACTECGAEADEPADHCDSCGAALEIRRLHEGSDVRIEPERLETELDESELSLPAGRWGRVSDHPGPGPTDSDRALARASERPRRARDGSLQPPRNEGADLEPSPPSLPKSPKPTIPQELPKPEASLPQAKAGDPAAAPRSPTPQAAHAGPSAELSHWLNDEAGAHPGGLPRMAAPSEARAATAVATTGSHAMQPRRPPVLASEALLRDLAPPRPARRALRFWCPLLGSLGASIAWLLTKGQGVGWPLAGAFAGLALLGLPPMPYAGRASAVATVAGTGLALVLWTDAASPDGASTIALTVSVTLLAAGLYFRAWHRASALARMIVSAGVLIGASLLWINGSLSDLTLFDTAWQSWLPRLLGLVFGLLLMLSLLAFMDPRSTGGASVWATLILVWHGMHAAVTILHAAWPKSSDTAHMERIPVDTLLAWASAPMLTALLSLGLAQLLAAGLSSAASRFSDPGMSIPPRPPNFGAPEVRARPHAR
jgi:hypothetical protein